MDEKHYRQTRTRRGHVYNYFYLPAAGEGVPTLLFLHGFPSTSVDWKAQITHFSAKGYGIIAPDLLGYGGTSAPSDASHYKFVAMANDVVEVLDALSIAKVIGIGHDWGSFLLSRLWNVHPERLSAAVFVAVGYVAPVPNFDYENYLALMNKAVGYDVFGYWEYFASADAPAKCRENIDSFYSLLFPKDPLVWKTDLAPRHKAREWDIDLLLLHAIDSVKLGRDMQCLNKQGPLPYYWDESAQKQHQSNLLKSGFQGPFNWYIARMTGLNNEDDSKIPQECYEVTIPVLFAAALQDYACLPEIYKANMSRYVKNLCITDFATSHWLPFEMPKELNQTIEGFINLY